MWRPGGVLLGILASGCSSSPARDEQDGAAGVADANDDAPLTYAPTYEAVYKEVLGPSCALMFCHGGAGAYLQLGTPAMGYASLVDAPAGGPMCAPTGLKRVDPGHPETSLLYLKVTVPPCGVKMPLLYGYSGTLDPRQIDQIRSWIACGAPDGDAGCLGDAPAD
jgi:hypothetical protein